METVLVTGAAGRIGAIISNKLLEQGFHVTGLDLQAASISHGQYQHIQTDFSDPEVLFEALKAVDFVLHIGAMMSWHPKDNNAMYQANVNATQLLLEAAHQSGRVKRFVFASTGEVYPEVNAEFIPVNEQHPLNPTSFYGLTKKIGEELVNFYSSKGLETCTLRFPHTQTAEEVCDPSSFFSGARFFLDGKIKQMDYFGNAPVAEQLRELKKQHGSVLIAQHGKEDGLPFMMHIADARDTADGVILAMTHPAAANEIFNLGPDDVVEFDKALPVMAETLCMPLIKVEMPGKAVRFVTSNLKMKTLLGYQPKYTFLDMVAENKIS